MWEVLPGVVGGLGAMLAAWFSYNQYTRNKRTDHRIEVWRAREGERLARRSDHAAQIYGSLWGLLHGLGADRVYILQPHPLRRSVYVSVRLEVRRNGVSAVGGSVQNFPMSDIAAFVGRLAVDDFIWYRDCDVEVRDKRARGLLASHGSVSVAIKRLEDEGEAWVGSVFCEWVRRVEVPVVEVRGALGRVASEIQYILPCIEGEADGVR